MHRERRTAFQPCGESSDQQGSGRGPAADAIAFAAAAGDWLPSGKLGAQSEGVDHFAPAGVRRPAAQPGQDGHFDVRLRRRGWHLVDAAAGPAGRTAVQELASDRGCGSWRSSRALPAFPPTGDRRYVVQRFAV